MDKNKIYEVVIKNFLGVMKERNLYHKFKPKIKTMFQDNIEYQMNQPRCNIFNEAWILNQMFQQLQNMVSQIYPQQKRDGSKFEFVVITTNCLLQKYLESLSIVKAMELPQIGEAIFTRSCEKLYGKNFRDEVKKLPTPQPPNTDLRFIAHELKTKFNIDIKDFINQMYEQSRINVEKLDLEEIEHEIVQLYQNLSNK